MKIDPEADSAARRIHKRGKMQKASFLGGRKLNGMVQTESRLEASAIFAALMDPRVIRIWPQPVTFDLNTGEFAAKKEELVEKHRGTDYRPRLYTPDFRLLLKNNVAVFLEIKHSRLLERTPEVAEVTELLANLGFPLIIISEDVLWGAVDQNARLLYPYSCEPMQPDVLETLLSRCSDPMRIDELLFETNLSQREVLQAIARGHVACDLQSARLGPQTVIWTAVNESYLEMLPL